MYMYLLKIVDYMKPCCLEYIYVNVLNYKHININIYVHMLVYVYVYRYSKHSSEKVKDMMSMLLFILLMNNTIIYIGISSLSRSVCLPVNTFHSCQNLNAEES